MNKPLTTGEKLALVTIGTILLFSALVDSCRSSSSRGEPTYYNDRTY